MGDVAVYMIWEAKGARIHQWGTGDNAKFAIGWGPIETITRERAEAVAGGKLP